MSVFQVDYVTIYQIDKFSNVNFFYMRFLYDYIFCLSG